MHQQLQRARRHSGTLQCGQHRPVGRRPVGQHLDGPRRRIRRVIHDQVREGAADVDADEHAHDRPPPSRQMRNVPANAAATAPSASDGSAASIQTRRAGPASATSSSRSLARVQNLDRWNAMLIDVAPKSDKLTGDSCKPRYFRAVQLDEAGQQFGLIPATEMIGQVLINDYTAQATGTALDGVAGTLIYVADLNTPGNKAFVAAWTAKFNSPPADYFAQAYNGMEVLFKGWPNRAASSRSTSPRLSAEQPWTRFTARWKCAPQTTNCCCRTSSPACKWSAARCIRCSCRSIPHRSSRHPRRPARCDALIRQPNCASPPRPPASSPANHAPVHKPPNVH